MAQLSTLDGILITWGDRLFYPGNRIVKVKPQPKFRGDPSGDAACRAVAIRKRIEATVVRRAPQVMVKVTGGGRGMTAIAAHFRYISKDGRLEVEDQRGETTRGKDSLRDLTDEWRLSGSLIPDEAEPGHRREAYNIMLSNAPALRRLQPRQATGVQLKEAKPSGPALVGRPRGRLKDLCAAPRSLRHRL